MSVNREKLQLSKESANDNVIEATSLELAIPRHLVEEVVNVQSKYVAERIKEGGFEGVLLPRLAKIRVKAAKVYHIHNLVGTTEIKKHTKINK